MRDHETQGQIVELVACVASVSIRVIARKLEREHKKNIPFCCSRPNFLDELARNRLLRTGLWSWGIADTVKENTFGGGKSSIEKRDVFPCFHHRCSPFLALSVHGSNFFLTSESLGLVLFYLRAHCEFE